jgi:hypothetical protein
MSDKNFSSQTSRLFVAPSGYVELDNDCDFSIDRKSTRSREYVDPKTDLAFYFNTYIVPKYGLDNINVSNVASFMKDLEMNWTKISPDMKEKVMNIMVDGILNKNGDFKSALLQKLNIPLPTTSAPTIDSSFTNNFSKSNFGSTSNNTNIILVISIIVVLYLLFKKGKSKTVTFGRLS